MDIEFVADPARLAIISLLGLALLIFLIVKAKLHALIALLITAAFIGFGSGMPMELVLEAFYNGVTNTLGSIALIVGLGAMFGGLLAATGGADVLANTLIDKFGAKKAALAVGITSLLVGIPVFYDAAFIILLPIVFQVALRTRKSVITFVIPMVAGIGLSQLIIPTPGPIIVSGQMNIDLGIMTVLAFLVVIPSWTVSGYFLGKFLEKKITVHVPDTFNQHAEKKVNTTVPVSTVVFIMISPILLIFLNSGTDLIEADSKLGNNLIAIATFIGQPFVALTIAILLAIYFLGIKQGFKREQLEKIMTEALNPVAIIVLVTAGGGVLKFMLDYSGTATLIGNGIADLNLPIIFVAFLTAVALRVSVGSAVVAMTMTAGIIAAMPQAMGLSPAYLALVGMAIITGSTSFSHVNDSGFWLFKEFLKIDLKTTFLSWTLYTGISSIVSFTFIYIISLFF